jgi:hypothetical protein
VRPIHADTAKLQQLHFLRQFQHFNESRGEGLAVVAPKRTNRVVVGVCIRAEVPHRDVPIGRALDAPGAENTVGIAVDEKCQQEVRRILFVTAALLVDLELRKRQTLDRLDDEVHEVVLRHPIAQVRRQQQGNIAVDMFESLGHAKIDG